MQPTNVFINLLLRWKRDHEENCEIVGHEVIHNAGYIMTFFNGSRGRKRKGSMDDQSDLWPVSAGVEKESSKNT